ncbi:lanthionine synthetase LanC family protein [Peribacillus butanolivorans]|uniref:class III lanthionine synthetase LanKC N-terminal domain-containing protein n=1 Tax=Peribacillus butanolivorans TaxID=421767 RepID=UPI003D26540D
MNNYKQQTIKSDLYREKLLEIGTAFSDMTDLQFHKDWAIFYPRKKSMPPKQGWKIHISHLPNQAIEVLVKISKLLIEERILWKTASNFHQIYNINNNVTLNQTGKIITIYPEDENQFIKVLRLLYIPTKDFFGPVILTDKKYKDSNCLYYRYGSFTNTYIFDNYTGVKTAVIQKNNGELVKDIRSPGFYKPHWIDDIILEPLYSHKEILENPFEKITFSKALKQSSKGGVYLTEYQGHKCILKESRKHVYSDKLGRDSRDRLLNEYEILRTLSSLDITPKPIKYFYADDNCYVLMEYIEGKTLRTFIKQIQSKGSIDPRLVTKICKDILRNITTIHEKGIVIRDLTPNNIILTPFEKTKIIDLELACELECNEPFIGMTPGYTKEFDDKPNFAVDKFALGAIFFFISTGMDPFFKKTNHDSLTDSLEQYLQIAISDVMLKNVGLLGVDLIRNASQNYSLDKIYESLSLIEQGHSFKKISTYQSNLNKDTVLSKTLDVAEYVYNKADFNNTTTLWEQNSLSNQYHISNFNSGIGGVAYFFCEVFEITHQYKYLYYAKDIIDWILKNHPYKKGETPIFLYFGYGSIPLILIKLGKYLKADIYIEAGLELANNLAAEKILQSNISHGAAGLGLMFLEIFNISKEKKQLENAQYMQKLIVQNKKNLNDLIYWDSIESVDGKLFTHKSIGFSHGIAGIGYFLLAMFKETGEEECLNICEEIIKSLESTSVITYKGKGISWPHHIDKLDSTPWIHWCNGASGVTLFLLNAYDNLRDDLSKKLLLKSLYTIQKSEIFDSFCQCHGLSGNGDILNYAYKILGDFNLFESAYKNGDKLLALKFDYKDLWLWTIEDKKSLSPEFMTGFLGVYSYFLRLFFDLPLPLSYNGFKV